MEWLENNIGWKVGNGERVRFWQENWIGEGPLGEKFPRLCSVAVNKDSLVANMGRWEGEVWRWS